MTVEEGLRLYRPAPLVVRPVGPRASTTAARLGDIDGFAYLDCGIYRPGETVHFNAMLRDREANALSNAPVTVIVYKPDGQEFRRSSTELKAGAVYQPFTLGLGPAAAGRRQSSTDPNDSPVGSASFDVQDFVPQKLKVTLAAAQPVLSADQPIEIDVESRFLYGAPSAGLGGEGHDHHQARLPALREVQDSRSAWSTSCGTPSR